MTTSGSRLAKPLSLLPFFYLLITRILNARDAVFLIASSWLPAIWFLHRSSEMPLLEAVLTFFIGYLAFVSVYEIGYLANDTWDARRSSDERQRTPFAVGPFYVALFIGIRVATLAAIGITMGWLSDPVWLAGFAALILAFAQHNLISARGLRAASFFQLATLRFVLPILAAVPGEDQLSLVLAGILFYTYLRFLSYLDSKELLVLPQRRRPSFGLIQLAMFSPFLVLIAFISGSLLFVELTAYFFAVYSLWFLLGRNESRGTI